MANTLSTPSSARARLHFDVLHRRLWDGLQKRLNPPYEGRARHSVRTGLVRSIGQGHRIALGGRGRRRPTVLPPGRAGLLRPQGRTAVIAGSVGSDGVPIIPITIAARSLL